MSATLQSLLNSKILAVTVFTDPKISFDYNFLFLIFLLYICSHRIRNRTDPRYVLAGVWLHQTMIGENSLSSNILFNTLFYITKINQSN